MSTETKTDVVSDALAAVQELLFPLLMASEKLAQIVARLAMFPEFDLKKLRPVKVDEKVEKGMLAFRRVGGKLMLVLVCGTKQVRYLTLEKFIALIECMDLGSSANIVLQNHSNSDTHGNGGSSQIIARVNPDCSAIHIVEGVIGKSLEKGKPHVANDAFYVPREELAVFYLAAKLQVGQSHELENLIDAHDGYKGYSIPVELFG